MTKKNANKRAARERQAQLGGSYLAHYRQVAAGETARPEQGSDSDSNRRDDVIRIAAEAGIPREHFGGWDGAQIALHSECWVDLGLLAFQITPTQWEVFKEKLDEAGLDYETHQLGSGFPFEKWRAAAKAELHLRLGRELNQRYGQRVTALKHFQDAFKLNPALLDALVEARGIYRELGKLNMVQKLLELQIKSTREGPIAAKLYGELGDVLRDQGDYDRATEAYVRAVQNSEGRGAREVDWEKFLENRSMQQGSPSTVGEVANEKTEEGEKRGEVVLQVPAILEDLDDPWRTVVLFYYDYRTNPHPVLAPGRRGGALKLDYDFAKHEWPWVTLLNSVPQRWERATAFVFDVFVPSPSPSASLELVAYIDGRSRYVHDAVPLAPGWNVVRLPFQDGKWEREAARKRYEREFDLSKIEPILGATFLLPGKGRKDRGVIFINNIRIE